jgi:hypothetical protein
MSQNQAGLLEHAKRSSPYTGHRKEKSDLAFRKLHDGQAERADVAMALSTLIREEFRSGYHLS